jgi:hypothetical protein
MKMMAYTTENLYPLLYQSSFARDKIIAQNEKRQAYTEVLKSLIKNGVMVQEPL